jgi:hypothetical protein
MKSLHALTLSSRRFLSVSGVFQIDLGLLKGKFKTVRPPPFKTQLLREFFRQLV